MNGGISTINLFEFVPLAYERIGGLSGNVRREAFIADLERSLSELWSRRMGFLENGKGEAREDSRRQSFMDIGRHQLRPRNWIGSFRFRSGDRVYAVNVLPKIFHRPGCEPAADDIRRMFAHILWWIARSGISKVAASRMDSGSVSTDLLEAIVGIFSRLALDVYSDAAYHSHSVTEETLETVRGAMDFNGYARNRARGLHHRIPCRFDSFRFDNRLNRIMKYVCVMLRDFTGVEATRRNLEEVLFILEDVGFQAMTAEDCDRVSLNPVHGDLTTLLDYCRLFLSSLSSLAWKDEYSVFGLLIRSEHLFESLLRSIASDMPPGGVRSVGTDGPGNPFLVRRLHEETARHYRMRHDIVLSMKDGSHVILDAKYKRSQQEVDGLLTEPDSVYGISRADMYQMISYAVGTGVTRIGVIYPAGAFGSPPAFPDPCLVDDNIAGGGTIRIQPCSIGVTHPGFSELDLRPGLRLEVTFRDLEQRIARQLSELVDSLGEK
jgi:5-methylcytosine-specific restriction enzyme subunit McrC